MSEVQKLKLITLFTLAMALLTGCANFVELPEAGSAVDSDVFFSEPGDEGHTTSPGQPSEQAGDLDGSFSVDEDSLSYPIVDTSQSGCYDNANLISCPGDGVTFYGQDAQFVGNQPQFLDNRDGTVTDLVTGLMWQQDPGDKMTYEQAAVRVDSFTLAGYDDWRLPSIKELYSLIQFSGVDPSGPNTTDTSSLTPFIDTQYFEFEYGDLASGERIIDSQWVSRTVYVGSSGRAELVFGVNFADGRIKGYGTNGLPGQSEGKTFFVIYVRGNPTYGQNDFVDNLDETISDRATGLTWTQADSGVGMVWEQALSYCQALEVGDFADWRLPDVKELQSLVDYTRSPETTNSAAISPLFSVTAIQDETGGADFPYYWSSTTHVNLQNGSNASYVSFGKALGYMQNDWINVHGAGAQRSDPKTGDASKFPTGHGPQGDAIRIENFVRCVRGGAAGETQVAETSSPVAPQTDQNPENAQQPPTGPGGAEPDLEAAAATLGVSEQALREVLGPPPPDLAVAAQKLGVTVQELQDALGLPQGPLPESP